jgi:Domain of unknown function (DUF4124)
MRLRATAIAVENTQPLRRLLSCRRFHRETHPCRYLRRLNGLGSIAALSLLSAAAQGEAFKCVDAAGKISYQAVPCQSTEPALKVQAPAPLNADGAERRPDAAAVPPGGTPKAAAGQARAAKDRIPSEADFRGPRETWERLGLAVRRGDKDAALRELTPSARQRLAEVFDTIGSKSSLLDGENLGSIRSVTLSGAGLATITLTRNKGDGIYSHQVHLMRDTDGKWRIDNM